MSLVRVSVDVLLLGLGWIYFSLSTREGHITGRSFDAQSSSLKRSAVAARASNAAFRAWTKGSRSDRAKAAERTLARFCQC